MIFEPDIRLADQLAVETPLAAARFVTRYQQYGAAISIERKRHTPLTHGGMEAQLLMFACFEPFSVSTRGRPSCGPNFANSVACASISSCTASDSESNSGSKTGWKITSQVTPILYRRDHILCNA
jgi:hypothetical protein